MPDALPKETDCMRAGQCVCTGAGRQLAAFRNRFLQAMKTMFRPGTDMRKLLLSGFVVAHIVGRPGGEGAGDGAAEPDQGTHLWLHVGLMYLSPYRPTFMRVEPVADIAECDPNPRRIYVKALAHYASHCTLSKMRCLISFLDSGGT